MNIVVIDADPNDRDAVVSAAASITSDVSVAAYASVGDALPDFGAGDLDLVILDVATNDKSTLGIASRLRRAASTQDVLIIFTSKNDDPLIRHAALDLGAIDFLIKPIAAWDLRFRLRNWLSLRRQWGSLKRRSDMLERRLLDNLREVESRDHEILHRLARAAEYRDYTTGSHLLRLSRYTEVVAKGVGLPESEIRRLSLAAPLHDIGKIGIPDYVLQKTGKLSVEEFAIMRKHPVIGHEMLRDSRSPFVQLGATIALRHHERWDGSGYPDGLQGNEIPMSAQIVAVADVYDALTSERPYKAAWGSAQALAYIENSRGILFSPQCVDALLAHRTELYDIQHAQLSDPASRAENQGKEKTQ